MLPGDTTFAKGRRGQAGAPPHPCRAREELRRQLVLLLAPTGHARFVGGFRRLSGRPSRGNWSSWNVVISVTRPPARRRTSMVNGR